MNKTIIYIILSIAIIFSVSAISIGDITSKDNIIPQDKLDDINVDNKDLNLLFIRENEKVTYDCDYYYCNVYVKMSTIDKINDELGNFTGNYKEVEKNSSIRFNKRIWIDIKREKGVDYTKNLLKNWILERKSELEIEEKNRIKSFQTDNEEIGELLSEI